jgi:hypothetical protein
MARVDLLYTVRADLLCMVEGNLLHMVRENQVHMVRENMAISNMWSNFKFRFKNFWRFLLGKERKIRLGWVVYEEVGIVILNDEAICKIDIEK